MESWILFSVLTAMCWATSNIIDKHVLTNGVRNPNIPVLIGGFIGLVASTFVYLLKGFPKISGISYTEWWILAAVAGVATILLNVFYFKAAKIEEISRVIPLYYTNPLFVALLAAAFLGETFTAKAYLGMALIMVGAIAISSKNFAKPVFGKAAGYILAAALMASIFAISVKYLLNFADFWTVFAYSRIGTLLALFPILYLNFRDTAGFAKMRNIKMIGLVFLSESLTVAGVISITIATSIGYATLVNTLSSLQPFFVLVFAVALSRFYPKVLHEEIGKAVIAQKLFAIILIFFGVILVA